MKGRHIPYSDEELAFIEARQSDAAARFTRRSSRVRARRREGRRHQGAVHAARLVDRPRAVAPGARRAAARALPDTPTEEIARRLGRELQATYRRAQALGLAKSAAYLASAASGRLQAGAARRGAPIHEGHVPANKGLRRPGWTAGRMPRRSSRRARADRHGGTVVEADRQRAAHDGYRWTKVTDIPGAPWTVNWKATHVLRWEQQHGPVPRGWCSSASTAIR
jgi:hypothetical protein